MSKAARDIFIVRLEALPSSVPPIIRLRKFLKVALRVFNLKCTDISEFPVARMIPDASELSGPTKVSEVYENEAASNWWPVAGVVEGGVKG